MEEIPIDLAIGIGPVGVSAGEDLFLRDGGSESDIVAGVPARGTRQRRAVLIGRRDVEGDGDRGVERDRCREVLRGGLEGGLSLRAEGGIVEPRICIGEVKRERELGE